jgi:hypothetical protein
VKFKVAAATLLILISYISPVNAIVNGTSAVGSNYVVTMLFGDEKPQGYCTGAYFQPRVVVIAAHCVIKSGARAPELQRPLADFHVSQPGIDWQTPEARTSRVKVLQIWTDPEYFNRWEPEKNLMEGQVNDIAFLFLEKELNGPTVTRAASRDEIESYRQGIGQGFHLGYGCIGGANGKIVANDGKPYIAEGITGTTTQPSHIPIRDRILNVLYPSGKSLCPGDSGSPLLMKKGEEVLYVGTLFAGGSWDDAAKGTNNRGNASATVLWPFIPTLEEEFKKFLVEESKQREIEAQKQKEAEIKAAADLKVKQEVEAQLLKERQESILANTFYKDLQNCHALDAKAELQILEDGFWKPLAQAKGWDLAINCPVTNPVQPWTIASIDKSADIRLLRWRIWIPGSWDVTGNQFESLLSTEAKAALALKAKQEADAKAAALKKTTIACVKGKINKKVTAVKPKCPAGYKKK